METGTRDSTAWRLVAGLALALVVLGQYWPGRLSGAGIGVYVLFVAVGALMTRSLLVERDVPVPQVVGDGLRLLVPPSLAVLAVAIAVPQLLPVGEWGSVLRDVRAAALGVLNLRPAEPDSPVAHLWIVAVLAQAAVVIFLLRRVLDRFHVRAASVIVLLLVAASFDAWLDNDSHALRGFGAVGLGVLAELVVSRVRVPARAAAILAGVAVVSVAGLATMDLPERSVPLLGVVLGLLLVVCGSAAGSPLRLLGDQPTVAAAGVAWATFCWAWPALQLAPEVVGHELGLIDRAVLLIGVVLVAVVTVLVLEVARYVLPTHWAWWPVLVTATAVATILVTMPSLERSDAIEADVARVEQLVTSDLPACYGASEIGARVVGRTCENPDLEGTTDPPPERIGKNFESFLGCWSQPHDDELHVCDLGSADGDAPRVLVVGDSHARVLFGAFRRLAERGALTVDATAKASCAWSTHPIEDKDPARIRSCESWRENLAAWLDEHATDYDVIVTTAYSGRMVGPKAEQVDGLVEAWEPVAAKGVPIVALRDNPRVKGDPDECLLATDPAGWGDCATARKDVVNHFDAFRPAAERVEGARFVDMWRYFCDDEECPAVIGGVGVHRDYNHVSARYAETLAPFVYREIAWTGVFRA